MSLIFMDGFDHIGDSDNLTKKYNNKSGTIAFATGRRSGSQALRFSVTASSSSGYVDKTLPAAKGTVIFGFAYYTESVPYDVWALFRLYDPVAGSQLTLALDTSLRLCLYRGAAVTLLATSENALSLNTWNYIEFKATISNTVGLFEVRVNGVVWATFSGDTQYSSSYSTVQSYRMYGLTGSKIGKYSFYDDLYICDSNGSTNNDYLGDCRVDTVLPSSVGTYSQFTPVGSATNYENVDEVPPDDDTSYNTGDTAAMKDSFGFSDLSILGSTIFGVQTNLVARKDDAGTRTLKPLIRYSSTDSLGSEVSLSDSYVDLMQVFETNPVAASSWTESSFNSTEFGYEVVS